MNNILWMSILASSMAYLVQDLVFGHQFGKKKHGKRTASSKERAIFLLLKQLRFCF